MTGAREILSGVPGISHRQIALYVAAAAIVLLVGWKYQAGSSAAPAYTSGSPPAGSSEEVPADTAPAVVVVDVSGAVRRPVFEGVRLLEGPGPVWRRPHPLRA